MTGRLHSIQSLGAVDGPGLRAVAFLQGCPLRCAYCHNPDTWDPAGGEEIEAAELAKRLLRYRGYWGKEGGVTVTGGEPLFQAAFVEELFTILQGEGVHTALDTSCTGDPAAAARVLARTNLVLADLKFLTEEDYAKYCRGSLSRVEAFLRLTEQMGVPLWIRHVVVPGLTDGEAHIRALGEKAASFRNLQKIELLPFRKLCLEKYRAMGIPFPLESAPEMDEAACEELARILPNL